MEPRNDTLPSGGFLKKRIVRIVLAAIVAPLAILPIVLAFLALVEPAASSASSFLKWYLLFAYVGLLIAYSATVVFGLPVYFLLLHLEKTSYVVFGAVGALAAVAIGVFLLDFPLNREDATFMVILVTCGIAVSVAFRRIAGVAENSGSHHE